MYWGAGLNEQQILTLINQSNFSTQLENIKIKNDEDLYKYIAYICKEIYNYIKDNYPNYYELSLCLLPSNGIIIIANMLWGGNVADPSNNDTQTETIRSLNVKIQKDERVDFSLLTISDGLSFVRKK